MAHKLMENDYFGIEFELFEVNLKIREFSMNFSLSSFQLKNYMLVKILQFVNKNFKIT